MGPRAYLLGHVYDRVEAALAGVFERERRRVDVRRRDHDEVLDVLPEVARVQEAGAAMASDAPTAMS